MQRDGINDTSSNWWLVSSGVIHGVLLRPIQFNNLVDVTDYILNNLAGNAKLEGTINLVLFRGTSTSQRIGMAESS